MATPSRVNYDEYWSSEARELKASALAELVNAFAGQQDVVTLHAGLPSTESFPLVTLSASTHHGEDAGVNIHSSSAAARRQQPTPARLQLLAPVQEQQQQQQQPDPCLQGHPMSTTPDCAAQRALRPVWGTGSIAGSTSSLSSICNSSEASASCWSEDSNGPQLSSSPPTTAHIVLRPAGGSSNSSTPLSTAACSPVTANGITSAGVVVGAAAESNPQGPGSSFQGQQEGQQQEDRGIPRVNINIGGALISDAQQYMFHSGHAPLREWALDLVKECHSPPAPVQVAITSGAVHALNAAVSCLCDRGDYVLCEEFAYTHAPECVFLPRGLTMLPVPMDEHGLIPSALRAILDSTPPSPVTGRKPRVLYTIPSGQNPTGAIMPVERKREVYKIAQEYGLIILEDDAYWWLQYPQGALPDASQQPGLQLPPTLLSMDTDGRVLRIDTFSKLLGPGYRLGWVTGAPQLVGKVAQAVQASSCGPCSLVQVIVAELLLSWGPAGFNAFVQRQQGLYARRAAMAQAAADEHLIGLAEWSPPRAGMFCWFKLKGLPDLGPELLAQLVAQRVVVVPGRPFWTDAAKARSGAPCPYFRVTFGAVPEADISRGFARLATAIKAAQEQLATKAAVAALATALPALAVETAAVETAATAAAVAAAVSTAAERAAHQQGEEQARAEVPDADASAVKEMQEAGELPAVPGPGGATAVVQA